MIALDLVIQSLRTADSSDSTRRFIGRNTVGGGEGSPVYTLTGFLSTDTTETVITIVLLVEVLLRIAADWWNFAKHPRDWVDLFIAVITTIIQAPPIHKSGQTYAWLTVFQIVRIYRVVLAVPLTRDLIVRF